MSQGKLFFWDIIKNPLEQSNCRILLKAVFQEKV